MKTNNALLFKRLDSETEEILLAHLDVLKGGGDSDAIDPDQILEVTIYGDAPDDETDLSSEEDYVDPDPDFWDDGDETHPWDDGNEGEGGGDSAEDMQPDLPDELCFTALFNQYPKSNPDGSPAHPSKDSYAHNQCAIRVGDMFTKAYGVNFATSDHYTGNVTSEGYPRGAKDVADWMKREGLESHEMTLSEFQNSEYYNQTGIIYQVGQSDSLPHIDIYTGGGNAGSGFYSNSKIVFFPIEDNGC